MPVRHTPPDAEDLLEALRQFGADAVSFLTFESGLRHWTWDSPDRSSHAMVAYADTGRAWVAVGAPLAGADCIEAVARAFVESARRARRRACFFATERDRIPGFSALLIGEQPLWNPAGWVAGVAAHRRLREQIRRPAAKGITVRRVDASDLGAGSPLHGRVVVLAENWLRSRRMAPMGFLVALEPFHRSEEHRYVVAEREGQVVAFLSAVPIYARRGWLVEDIVRGAAAPNGTTEALIDALMRDVSGSEIVTLGLAPLAGPVALWLRAARFVGSPMFDFQGLRRFRQRLRPAGWERVWLLYPAGQSPARHVLDSLTAFARGSLLAFALRCAARRPSGPPWALALPLVPWTLFLAALVVAGRADVVGFKPAALAGWVAFDALLTVQLFRSALRPRRARFAVAAVAALVDAGFSVPHLVVTGLGTTIASVTVRTLAAAAPCLGAIVLTWLVLPARPRRA
jgi:phosphatidylglycerol lysyltransferase